MDCTQITAQAQQDQHDKAVGDYHRFLDTLARTDWIVVALVGAMALTLPLPALVTGMGAAFVYGRLA